MRKTRPKMGIVDEDVGEWLARGKGASSNRPLNVALKESLVKALNNGRFSLDDVPVHGAVLTKNKKAHWQTILCDMKAEYFSLYAGRGILVEHDSQIQSDIASKSMSGLFNAKAESWATGKKKMEEKPAITLEVLAKQMSKA